jgi:hypothetical protein
VTVVLVSCALNLLNNVRDGVADLVRKRELGTVVYKDLNVLSVVDEERQVVGLTC